MPLPGTAIDDVTVTRSSLTVDPEGNYNEGGAGPVVTFSGRGAYGTVQARDLQTAAQRGQLIDATVILPSNADVLPGDALTVRGDAYTVVEVRDVRVHLRAFVRGRH